MIRLSDGDVRQSDVLQWAQEQAVFLRPPSTAHVLLYLCANAFYKSENREGKKPGNVLTGRTRLRTIAKYTGLGRSTIKRALDILQDNGYVLVSMDGGREPNGIYVAWNEDMDDVRQAFRAGRTPLPKIFEREVPEPALKVVETDAVVLDFKRRPSSN